MESSSLVSCKQVDLFSLEDMYNTSFRKAMFLNNFPSVSASLTCAPRSELANDLYFKNDDGLAFLMEFHEQRIQPPKHRHVALRLTCKVKQGYVI